MKLLVPLCILASLAFSRAQTLVDQLPLCAVDCVSQMIRSIPCSLSDQQCICSDIQSVALGVAACAGANCTVVQTLSSENSTMAFCGAPLRDASMTLNIISGLFGALVLLVVSLRMTTRIPPFRVAFGWDDGLILVAAANAIFTSVNNFIMTHHGFGRDIFTISPQNIETILKMFYAGEMTYDIANAVSKLSILAFYRRIFTETNFIRSTYILMGIILAFLFAILPATIFQCTPISYMWTGWSGETEGHCIDVSLLTWLASSINILQDIAVIILPIPRLLKLSLSRKKKVQIIFMFCVGLFVTIASIVRLSSLIKFKTTLNFSWDYVAVCYMSVLEADIGVICACMPAMQLLLRRFAPGIFGSTADQSSYLRPHNMSHSKTFGARRSMPPRSITKTITTTIIELPKDSDSTIELVETPVKAVAEGGSVATVSTADQSNKPNPW